MNTLIASAFLLSALCAPSISGWKKTGGGSFGGSYYQQPSFPAQQPQGPFNQNNNPSRGFPPLNNDPWQPGSNPGFPSFPGQFPSQGSNPGRGPLNPFQPSFPAVQPGLIGIPNQPQQSNQCQRYSATGDCRFYNCFAQIEPTCQQQGVFYVQSLNTLCQNVDQLTYGGQVSSQGNQYLQQVKRCQIRQMASLVNSQSCQNINNQAERILIGDNTSSGFVDPNDCYWQNQQFCNIIGNAQADNAMVQSLFGNSYGQDQIRIAQHLQYLSTLCPQRNQNTFNQNFVNRCPPGTVTPINTNPLNPSNGRQNSNQQMMMMGGPGGD